MAAPNYSPGPGQPTVYTDADGATYRFDGTFWQQISSGAKAVKKTTTTQKKTTSSGGGGGSSSSGNFMDYYIGWNPRDAEADFKAAFGSDIGRLQQARGVSPGGGGDIQTSGTNEFADLIAQLAGAPYELPPLQVKSFEEYEKEALEELRPYYERILKEEGGDVEKAKLRIQQDYDRGIRINREDYEVAKGEQGTPIGAGESVQGYYNRAKNDYGVFPEEGVALLNELAKRGVLHSGIATADTAKMATSQQRRQEAIKRAQSRYEESAGITKGRGLEDISTAWERRQFELGEEKKERAGTLGRQARADEIALQEIERANIMRKAIQNVYG